MLQEEWDDAKRQDKEWWQNKLVVKDADMHFYRCNPQTEAIQRGPKASNELSKLENLLRDPPMKHSFAAPRLRTGENLLSDTLILNFKRWGEMYSSSKI